MKLNPRTSYLFLIVLILSTACGKNDEDPPPPVPEKFDTLGIGWQKISIPDSSGFNDIFFVDDATGYLCGKRYMAKSTDGGISWTRYKSFDSVQEILSNIFFIDANHGWLVGSEFLYRTENGGTSWQAIKLPPPLGNNGGFDVQFLTSLSGYLINGESLYKSTDGGVTWTKKLSVNNIAGLFFFDFDKGWITGDDLITRTENGGGSFSFEKPLPASKKNYSIQFTDDQHGWVTGAEGSVWRTIDGGNNWEQLIGRGQGGDVSFFDNNNGYILSDSKIYKTSDGGKTLEKHASIKSLILEIHFTNPNHGWAAGDYGGVYRYSK
ncbi:MAG: YCF48-related protein [Chitinophagaceae bacterium]